MKLKQIIGILIVCMMGNIANAELVSHWKLDGDLTDSAGEADGSFYGTSTEPYADGVWNSGLELNGIDDYVMIDSTVAISGDYSVSGWFKAASAPADNMDIISITENVDSYQGILIEISSAGIMRYLHRYPFGVDGGVNIYSSESYLDDSWHHFAAINSGNTISLYMDGVLCATDTIDEQINDSTQINMGRLSPVALVRYFEGTLDDIRIYSHALTEDEIDVMLNDNDNDGVHNDIDNCPDTANADQADYDGDGIGDECDLWPYDPDNDIDGDGVSGNIDNCPNTHNDDQADMDHDGIGDVCDDDTDGDGVLNVDDNCPFTPNPGQEDADGDGIGDVCDCVIYVDSDGPAPYSVIQDAIDAAVDGDTVVVLPGVYVENINMSGKAITLQSTDPTNPATVTTTIIDGNANGSVITCNSGEGSETVITGFVITNGSAFNGGGLENSNSSPTVSNCTFRGNTAEGTGGGMLNYYSSSPTISNCSFSGNTTGGSGGGMFNWIFSSPTISNCSFSGNTAGEFGGGMFNFFSSSPTLTNCTFSGNTAVEGGGIMNTNSSSPKLTNCIFSGNTADYGGGMETDSFATLTNCIFSGNTAGSRGGGMRNLNASPKVSGSYFCYNEPDNINGSYTDNGGNNFEFCPPPSAIVKSVPGDLTGDDKVDMADLAVLAANWLSGL